MNYRRPLLSILLGLSALFLLTGCKFTMLDPKGIVASQEIHILIFATLLMLIVVIPVIFMALYFSWRYRANRPQAATYTPNWSHNTWIEVVCWSIPCLIILILGRITWVSAHELDPYRPIPSSKPPLVIQVIAYEWKWFFIYPEQQIAAVNFMQIPIDRPIELLITADGPMNSLQIPQLAGQIYAMAGMKTQLHLMANTIGDYKGISANFSGDGFADMKFIVRASTTAQFNAWVNNTQKTAAPLTPASYRALIQHSENNPVQLFSKVKRDLFQAVLMAPMMPMNQNKK